MINYKYCQAMVDYIESNDVDLFIIIQQIYEAGYNDGRRSMIND